jgi:hypothetical protein
MGRNSRHDCTGTSTKERSVQGWDPFHRQQTKVIDTVKLDITRTVNNHDVLVHYVLVVE